MAEEQGIQGARRFYENHAFCKAIIVGEHAVVYGARAVAMPVNLKLTLALQTEAKKTAMTLNGVPVSDRFLALLDDAFKEFGSAPRPVAIKGHSFVPVGAGLGFSASLCVLMLKLVAQVLDRSVSLPEIAQAANRLEQRFHGTPSGLDTTVVTYERVIAFQKGLEPTFVSVIPPKRSQAWRFALIDSGVRAATISMVRRAAPYFQCTEGPARIAQFTALADTVITGLKTGSLRTVAHAMDEASILLTAADVVPPNLAAIIDQAKELGAIAAKPTGAGGGGCILTLLSPNIADDTVINLRSRFGAENVHEVSLC